MRETTRRERIARRVRSFDRERIPGWNGVVHRIIRSYSRNQIRVCAGYATLRICTAFFPLCMLVIAVSNRLPGYSPQRLVELAFSVLPKLPEVQALFTGAMSNLQAQSSGLLASVAALTALWSASSGVSALQLGLRRIQGGHHSTHGIRHKLISLLFTLGLIVLMPAMMLFNLLGDSLGRLIDRAAAAYGLEPYAEKILSFMRMSGILTTVVSFLFILIVYKWLTEEKRTFRSQLPGALLTALCWMLFTRLFSVFIPVFWKSTIYGSLASFFLTVLWLEIAINILFIGSALNEALLERSSPT